MRSGGKEREEGEKYTKGWKRRERKEGEKDERRKKKREGWR